MKCRISIIIIIDCVTSDAWKVYTALQSQKAGTAHFTKFQNQSKDADGGHLGSRLNCNLCDISIIGNT